VFAYLIALSIPNPAFVATVLMGAYAIAGGLVLGTCGARKLPRVGTVLILAAVGMFAWMAVLLPDAEYRKMARARDIQLIVGVFLSSSRVRLSDLEVKVEKDQDVLSIIAALCAYPGLAIFAHGFVRS
jgi:hypothetical protein